MENDSPFETFDDATLRDVDMDALKTEFRELRKARRLSQGAVADLLKVSQATISAFEKGTYPTVRKKTLNGIWKLVQFWRRDSSRIVKGDFVDRRIVAVPDRNDAGRNHMPLECPHCHGGIPELETPVRFCPGCGHALGLTCGCGNVVFENDANFCCRCGRSLIVPSTDPRPYSFLKDDENERFRLALRRSLAAWVDDITGDSADSLLRMIEPRGPEKSRA